VDRSFGLSFSTVATCDRGRTCGEEEGSARVLVFSDFAEAARKMEAALPAAFLSHRERVG
jgi:hypothetical protein